LPAFDKVDYDKDHASSNDFTGSCIFSSKDFAASFRKQNRKPAKKNPGVGSFKTFREPTSLVPAESQTLNLSGTPV